MSAEVVPESVPPSSEIAQDESIDAVEEYFEDFSDFEEQTLSEEGSIEYSGKSVFTQGTIVSYSPEEHVEEPEPFPDDPLKEVPSEHYPDMLFQMGNDFPNAVHAYVHVHSLIRWKKIFPETKISILAPGGDYKNGIYFFSVYKGNFNGSAYCHEKTNKSILHEALANSRYVPTKDQYNICRFTSLTTNTFEAVRSIFSKENWCRSEDVVMWLPWYCAREMEVNLPNNIVEIRELGPAHIDLINESWQENFPGSRDLIDDMFDVHRGLGLFDKDILLAWALVWYHGGIGIIQTVEIEKRKGYSGLVVQALTKRMGECLDDVHLNITRGRRRDLTFFRALGFRLAFQGYSFETKKYEPEKKKPEAKPKILKKPTNEIKKKTFTLTK